MTTNTVPAMLDAVLDPLNDLQEQVQAALLLAQRNRLPPAFVDTIKAAVANIEHTWETLNEIVTALDPNRGKPQP